MKILITENQAQDLIKILNEDNTPNYMKDIPVPPQLTTLISAMSGANLDKLISKLGPNGMELLKKLFGVSDLGDISASDLNQSNIIPNTTLMNPLGNLSVNIGSKFNAPRVNRRHRGVDFPVKSGTPIYAPANGIIISARDTSPNPCGGFIQINHGNLITKFCHLSKWNVSNGEQVKKGQIIGYTGGGINDPHKGRSSGAHLHYEILDNKGVALNPQQSQFGLA